MKYIKDGKIYDNITQLKYNGRLYINPTQELILAAGYKIYVEPEQTDEEKLANAISEKIDVIERYGDRDDRNSYIAMGVTIRLSTELRLRLRNVINAKIAEGVEVMTEWYEGHSYTYPITAWDKQLTAYENFLYDVACVTEQHKSKLRALSSITEVESYDYTTGYPEILNFDVDNRTDEEKLADAKDSKIAELVEYDSSSAVNIYYYDGNPMWLDKSTRVGLVNAIDMLEIAGKNTIDIWYEGTKFTATLSAARSMLSAIEIYALDCFNVTEQHKLSIKALETIDEVESYDFTTGYPDKIQIGSVEN